MCRNSVKRRKWWDFIVGTHYFKNLSLKELLDITIKHFKLDSLDKSFLEKLCPLFQDRSENINDFLSGIEYMISVKEIPLSENASQIIKNTKKQILDSIIHELENINNWDALLIETLLKNIANLLNIKKKD